MPAPSLRPRGRLSVLLAILGVVLPAAALSRAEDGRVDPLRAPRLTAAERERLFEQAARDAEAVDRQARQLQRLALLLRPSVVHIDANKPALRPRFGKANDDESGSGVIATIVGRTVVLTNRHVIDRAPLDSIVITLDDDREVRPIRLWADAGTDLAVMEIDAPDVVPARLAAADTVEIGDSVIAFGSPFGLSRSLSLGIVSATGRRALEFGERAVKYQDFIQTDAPINPGNSGGPLVNFRGEVVGINTCIASNSGIFEGLGFAIPVGMVTFVARQLVEHGSVARGYLGLMLDREFSQAEAHRLGMVRPVGAHVDDVVAGAPAAEAGLRRDDVVIEFEGRAVEDDDHLISLVSTTPVDTEVKIVIFRDGARMPLQLPVVSRDAFEK